MGIVYLVQPCELVGTDRYKIGRSSKDDLSRVLSYKKGTRYISIMECDDDKSLEKLLINEFNEKFKKIAGNEYFQGDVDEMFNCFIKIVSDYKNDIIEDIPDTIKLKKISTDWMQKFKSKYIV